MAAEGVDAGDADDTAQHGGDDDDVVSVTADQRPRLLQTLKARLKDTKRVSALTTRRARHVHLKVSAPCEMRIDDSTISVAANTAVEIFIKPGALEFVLPG